MARQAAAKEEISVKIGAFPGGQIKDYTFPKGTTYKEGIAKAQLAATRDIDGLDIRVGGQRISDANVPMTDGDQVLIFSKIRGN